MDARPGYCAFLVRIWTVRGSEVTRAVVEDVETGDVQAFRDLGGGLARAARCHRLEDPISSTIRLHGRQRNGLMRPRLSREVSLGSS